MPAADRALQAGAASADVVAAMRLAAYEAIFGVLDLLDSRGHEDAPRGSVGWVLVPAVEDEHGGLHLGDVDALAGLHEDFLVTDPTGQEGVDFMQ